MYKTKMKLLQPYLPYPLDFSDVVPNRKTQAVVGMLKTGAKVYARRVGCVTELFVSGYLPDDGDVPMDVRVFSRGR